jgi:hypothetical protein
MLLKDFPGLILKIELEKENAFSKEKFVRKED